MSDEYSYKHYNTNRDKFIEIDIGVHEQELLMRYRYLKRLKESDLSLEDQLFLENFKTAMRIFWVSNPPKS